MRSRSLLFLLVLLLVTASLAGAAQTPTVTPADPASATLAAIFTAPAPPDGGAAKLPSFAPAPTDKAITCGSCSDSPCVGQPVGTYCYSLNGLRYTCQLAYVVCSARDCECWNGPLP